MARYTEAEKTEAVALYVEHGLAEAARRTGISKGSIRNWAEAAGMDPAALSERAAEQTKAATAQRTADMEAKRVTLRERLVDKALDMLARMDEPQIDYRGTKAEPVSWEKATPQACQSYATAAAICIDKLRLELGEETDRVARVPWDPKAVADEAAPRAEGLRAVPDVA